MIAEDFISFDNKYLFFFWFYRHMTSIACASPKYVNNSGCQTDEKE